MSKRIGRRSIAALLAAVMVLTTAPVSVSAAETVEAAEEALEEVSSERWTEVAEEVVEEKREEEQTERRTTIEAVSEIETEQAESRMVAEAVGEDEANTSGENKNLAETEVDTESTVTKEAIEEAETENESVIEEETTEDGNVLYATSQHTQDEAVAWVLNCAANNTKFNNGQCVFLIRAYYEYLGYSAISGNGKDYSWNELPDSTWNRYQYYTGFQAEPGDIAVWTSGDFGHVEIITSVYNGGFYSVGQNVTNLYCTGPHNRPSYGMYNGTDKIACVIRPKFKDPIPFDRVKGSYMNTGYYQTIPNGDYHIVSAQGDRWWLTNSGFSKDNGGNVQIWDYIGIDMECTDHVYRFEFKDGGNGRGFYKITNLWSGKCLDVDGASEYLYDENGKRTNVQQWEDNGASAQQWAINEINGGDKGMLYTFQARCSSYYLDVEGGNADCGSNISVWPTGSDYAQQWRLVPYAPAVGQTIEDGEYQIVYSMSQNKAIGFTGNKVFDGVNVESSSSYKGDYRQTFNVKYLGNGYYSIINKYSGLSLDVVGGPNMRKLQANIQLWTSDAESDAQKWIIKSCGNGYYSVISKCNGLYLDLEGGDAKDVNNISMWHWNSGGVNQQWQFIPYVQSKLSTPTSTLSNTTAVDAGTKFYLNKNGADDIYYTWDGTTPTKQSTKYSDSTGLTIPTGKATCTLKAFGVKEGYQDSDILEITYTVKQNTSENPSEEESSEVEGSDDTPEDEDPQEGVKWHYNDQKVIYKDLSQYGQIETNIKPKTYDGTPYKPAVKVTAIENGKTVTLMEGIDYRVLYFNNIHAGTGSVIVKGNGVYKGTISRKFEIKKKSCQKLKVVTNSMLTGDSAAPKIYVYDGNILLKENKDYTLDGITPNFTATKGTKQIYVMAAQNSDYEGVKSAKITVYDADKGRIKGIIDRPENVTLSQSTYQYTGKACKPTATVTVDGNILTAGKDYTIKYQNNKETGTAFATITGKGSYVGSVVKEFTIKPSNGEFTLKKPIAAVTYNGKLQKPKITVTADGKTLKQNKDYTLTYTNNLHATDRAKVTVRGKGNYAAIPTKIFYFTINPCHIKKASVKGGQGSLLITHAKHTLVEGVDYDVIYGDVSGKGKISVTIKAKEGSSFTGEITKKVKQ